MSNFDKYNFSDFTRAHYATCIDLAKRNYEFITYPEVLTADKFILWRHDVDFSMHIARKLAQIEADKGVRATYFIYPHCEFYNLLEKEIFVLVKDIQKLGHRIGLHFDSHFYDIQTAADLDMALGKEKNLLESFFDAEIDVFSFHNNNAFTMVQDTFTSSFCINIWSLHAY